MTRIGKICRFISMHCKFWNNRQCLPLWAGWVKSCRNKFVRAADELTEKVRCKISKGQSSRVNFLLLRNCVSRRWEGATRGLACRHQRCRWTGQGLADTSCSRYGLRGCQRRVHIYGRSGQMGYRSRSCCTCGLDAKPYSYQCRHCSSKYNLDWRVT